MPAFSNPYYGPTYAGASYGYPGYSGTPTMPAQSYASQPSVAAAWVEGEIEAHGRQMPQGVTQFFMFDANRQKIYLKSLNQMGMPNPMQTLSFTIDDQPQGNLPAGQSGAMGYTNGQSGHDMSQYVTRQDFDQLRNEIRQMTQSGANGGNSNMSGQNGSANQNGGGNRGGNR